MSERRDVIERLREVLYELTDSVGSHARLSKICGAVYPDAASWDLFACEALGGEIIRLLDDADAEVDAVRSECSEMLDKATETCRLIKTEHDRELSEELFGCKGFTYLEVTYDCDQCGFENHSTSVCYCGGCGRVVIR